MSLKKFLKTVVKHGKEHTKILFDPKAMHEHLKDPLKDHFRQYNEFTETTVGKVVFAVVSFYVGGILSSAISGGGTAASAAGETAGQAAGQAAGQTTGQAAQQVLTDAGAQTAGSAAATQAAAQTTGQVTGQAAGQVVTDQAAKGFWSKAVDVAKGIGTWAKENPEVVATVAGGVASMATPDELDIMEAREEQRLADIERKNRNLEQVGQVNLGLGGAPQPLRDKFGNLVYSQGGGLRRDNFGGLLRQNNRPRNPYQPLQEAPGGAT